MKQVGIIVAGSAYPMDGFKSGLQDVGWVEGKNLSLQIRAAEGQLHLLPEFAAAMVNTGVDLIAVIGAVTVRAVRQATSSIPSCLRWLSSRSATDWPRTWNAPAETSPV